MDLNPEDRRLLAIARAARTPAPHDKARVAARLTTALGASASAASLLTVARAAASTPSIASSVGGSALLKWWLGGAMLVAASIGVQGLQTAPRRPVETRVSPRQGALQAPAAREPESPVPHSEPSAARPSETRAPSAIAGSAASARARRSAAAGPSELELLHGAHAAWRSGDAARATKLLSDHRRRYPRSLLRLERDALQVLAWCEVGDRAEAARLARQLLARAPDSPLRTSIEQSCAFR
jgi:hypothetical protein